MVSMTTLPPRSALSAVRPALESEPRPRAEDAPRRPRLCRYQPVPPVGFDADGYSCEDSAAWDEWHFVVLTYLYGALRTRFGKCASVLMDAALCYRRGGAGAGSACGVRRALGGRDFLQAVGAAGAGVRAGGAVQGDEKDRPGGQEAHVRGAGRRGVLAVRCQRALVEGALGGPPAARRPLPPVGANGTAWRLASAVLGSSCGSWTGPETFRAAKAAQRCVATTWKPAKLSRRTASCTVRTTTPKRPDERRMRGRRRPWLPSGKRTPRAARPKPRCGRRRSA